MPTPGQRVRLVEHERHRDRRVQLRRQFYAIEDRCSHDDGPLAEGELDSRRARSSARATASIFDLKTGRPKTLPAYQPVDTFPVIIDNDMIKLEVD